MYKKKWIIFYVSIQYILQVILFLTLNKQTSNGIFMLN